MARKAGERGTAGGRRVATAVGGGYYANDDYNLAVADIHGIHMQRGKKHLHGEHVEDVRFARKPDGQKKIATWSWKDNTFSGTRELNGLRVMMALVNSWDLKDENNAVFYDKHTQQQVFLVSDVGTAFGRTGLHFLNGPSKDRPVAYAKSKFISHQDVATVSFANPSPAWSLEVETLGAATKQFLRRQGMLWIGDDIPKRDARWIGGLLGELSHQQLVDAFRAGNYSDADVALLVEEIERRIAALKAL